jgi:hypothetical protein
MPAAHRAGGHSAEVEGRLTEWRGGTADQDLNSPIEAAQQCIEKWLESPTCLEIEAKYPRRTPATEK